MSLAHCLGDYSSLCCVSHTRFARARTPAPLSINACLEIANMIMGTRKDNFIITYIYHILQVSNMVVVYIHHAPRTWEKGYRHWATR